MDCGSDFTGSSGLCVGNASSISCKISLLSAIVRPYEERRRRGEGEEKGRRRRGEGEEKGRRRRGEGEEKERRRGGAEECYGNAG